MRKQPDIDAINYWQDNVESIAKPSSRKKTVLFKSPSAPAALNKVLGTSQLRHQSVLFVMVSILLNLFTIFSSSLHFVIFNVPMILTLLCLNISVLMI